MTNAKALTDALRLLAGLDSADLLQIAATIEQWEPGDCRDLAVNLAHVIAITADRVST
jgi:hypothetical protein